MKHLQKIKPSGRGLAAALPHKVQGGTVFYELNANAYVHYEEFVDGAIDTAEWADDSTLGTGGAVAITFASSFAILDTSTGTAGTSTQRLRSATSSNGNIYNVPFRVTYWARISTTAGAGVAPTGGLDVFFGIRNSSVNVATDEGHIAQFHLDLTTAGGSSLANPVVNVETRCGSTVAAFINSAAHTIFNSAVAAVRTATTFVGYSIEIGHRGVAFGITEDRSSIDPPQLLSYFGTQVPRIDQNYFLDMRIVANGTAGFTQTDGVQVEIDSVVVEQMTPTVQPMTAGLERAAGPGAIRTAYQFQALASAAVGLVTTGSGLFVGFNANGTLTTGSRTYLTAFDASAAGSAVYDFQAAGLPSAGARIIWNSQVTMDNSSTVEIAKALVNPPMPIPFFRGLIVGATTLGGSAAGSTALHVTTLFQSQK